MSVDTFPASQSSPFTTCLNIYFLIHSSAGSVVTLLASYSTHVKHATFCNLNLCLHGGVNRHKHLACPRLTHLPPQGDPSRVEVPQSLATHALAVGLQEVGESSRLDYVRGHFFLFRFFKNPTQHSVQLSSVKLSSALSSSPHLTSACLLYTSPSPRD